MKYSVLLIEDNACDAALVVDSINTSKGFGGFEIHHVETMREATESLSNRRFDAILLDLNLPDSHGLETLTIAGAHAMGVPIIVVTSIDDQVLGLKALRFGAADYLVKGQVFGTMLARAVTYAVQRHQTDAALRATQARHRQLFDTMAQGAVYHDDAGRVTAANAAALEFLGQTLDELQSSITSGFNWDAVNEDGSPFDPNQHPSAIALRTGVEKNSTYMGIYNPREASYRWLMVHARPHFDPGSNKPAHIFTTFTDVTALHRAEEELRLEKTRLAAVVDTSPLAIVVIDDQHRVQLWSPAAERIFGWSADEVVGYTYPLKSPDGGDEPANIFGSAFDGDVVNGTEIQRITKAGESRNVQLWNARLLDAHGKSAGLVGIMADVSAQKRLQESLRHAQKMEAVGRLAGGIAHDFNNILTALGGHVGLLLDQTSADAPIRDDLLEIEQGVARAAKLTRQLLTFSRKQVVQPRVIDLTDLMLDIDKMLQRVMGEHINLVVTSKQPDVCVNADPGQLEQVLVNLAVNARDAMPLGGELFITASIVTRDSPLDAVTSESNKYALLEFADTGTGIPADVKPKIFEPFFTTKPQGKGTGLGLPTVYGIVEQAGGWIEVESEIGNGAIFRIYLPYCESKPASEPVITKAPINNTGVILLVEDEPSVRQLAERVLVRSGYTVLSAAGGQEAAAIAAGREQVDLLITDVVMPLMSGPEVAKLLQQKWSSLEVLFMSGYTEETISDHGVLREGLQFLEKPFTPDQLVSKVAHIIAAAGTQVPA